MKELQVFQKEELGKIRTLSINNEPWFVLTDVCQILHIKNITQVAKRLDHDERSMSNIGLRGKVNIINESGLYKVILKSDKKEAKPFIDWVTKEVLPTIRRTGSYEVPGHDNLNTLFPERLISIDDMTLGQIKDYITKLEKQMNKFDELKNVLREIHV